MVSLTYRQARPALKAGGGPDTTGGGAGAELGVAGLGPGDEASALGCRVQAERRSPAISAITKRNFLWMRFGVATPELRIFIIGSCAHCGPYAVSDAQTMQSQC